MILFSRIYDFFSLMKGRYGVFILSNTSISLSFIPYFPHSPVHNYLILVHMCAIFLQKISAKNNYSWCYRFIDIIYKLIIWIWKKMCHMCCCCFTSFSSPDSIYYIWVFLKGTRNSVNSAKSGNLINHWSMNWAQIKDPLC